MSKYRIYDIAKELNTENKTILDILHKHNIEAKSHSSTIDDTAKQVVIKALQPKPKQPVQQSRPVSQQDRQPRQAAGDGQRLRQQSGTYNQPKTNRTDAAQSRNGNQSNDRRPSGQRNYSGSNAGNSGNNNARRPQQYGNNNSNTSRPQQHGSSGINTGRPQQHGSSGSNTGRPQQHGNNSGNAGRPQNRPAGGNQPRQHNSNNTGSNNNNNNRPEQNDRNNRNDVNNNHGNRMERTDHMEKNDRNRQPAGRNDRSGKNGRSNFGNNGSFGNRNNRGRYNRNRNNQPSAPKMEIARPKNIKVGESIIVKDLASKMSCTAAEIIKKLMLMGVLASINQEIDFDTAVLVAGEFGVNVEELPPEVDPTLIPEIVDEPKSLVLRPPVVTVMGHVDHGKTSLLDVIRKTSVTTHEAGGITQHIGAYQVKCQGRKIVFLDTPGHEAFTAMRARGAQVTDIAILVVAADDGVMPQTVEAINHAKDAGVPIIVAVNKIDKPGANPANVKNELMEHGLVPEEYGGETIMVEVSAKKNIGIGDLLEMILLVAEMKELKANPKREARGVIIEAQLDKGRGPVATVLVQSGTLRIGDSIVAGTTYGKVRAMLNDRGENVKKAGPSVPVEVLGLNDVPAAGDELAALDEKHARSIAEKRMEKQRNDMIHSKKVSLDDLFNQIQEGQLKDLNIVVKADVQGSVEALNSSLMGLNRNDEVRVRIVHSGVGAVTESDVMLASASNALVIAFNVRPDANARRLADTESIDIRTYRVIYDALNDVEEAMSGMLAPKYKEIIQGRVEIRQVMKFSKALVAGSYVLEGKITNQSKIRIVRDNIEVFDGELDGLRRFKDDVKDVAAGYECGITIKDYKDFREGDIIEAYIMEEVKTTISDVNKD